MSTRKNLRSDYKQLRADFSLLLEERMADVLAALSGYRSMDEWPEYPEHQKNCSMGSEHTPRRLNEPARG
ncbi:MAG TPA: hypothetical protein VIT91_20960 [Chthoniobacterales bacterium]